MEDNEADKIRKKYRALEKQELDALRAVCSHEYLTEWMDEEWAMAHSTGFSVQLCATCDKEMHRRTTCRFCWIQIQDDEILKGGNGEGDFNVLGINYCKRCEDPKTRIYRCNWCGHDAGPRLGPTQPDSHFDGSGHRICERTPEKELDKYFVERLP